MASLAETEKRQGLEALDRELRLWSTKALATAVGYHPTTVGKHVADSESALAYTHAIGRRRFFDHATASAWAASLPKPVELKAALPRPRRHAGLYSRGELAALAGCSVSHLAAELRAGALVYTHKVGAQHFFDHAAARRWVSSLRIEGQS